MSQGHLKRSHAPRYVHVFHRTPVLPEILRVLTGKPREEPHRRGVPARRHHRRDAPSRPLPAAAPDRNHAQPHSWADDARRDIDPAPGTVLQI